ncbi:MAG TPA: DUF805 domain-containing protein [Acidimicrobiales bacterium]|nr:DUF805 domain-containing protein [Acidimicrobiales bacterium]
MKYYIEAWKRYVDFKGRSSRPAYWWPFLLTIIISFVLGGISASVFGTASDEAGPLETIFQLAWLCPGLALGARRLHDIGRSGWWLLIALTGVGVIVLIIWACRPGEDVANAWGSPSIPLLTEDDTETGVGTREKPLPDNPIS